MSSEFRTDNKFLNTKRDPKVLTKEYLEGKIDLDNYKLMINEVTRLDLVALATSLQKSWLNLIREK